MNLTTGNQENRVMNGSRSRENTLQVRYQAGVQNSHGAVHTVHRYLPCRAGALKGEHLPGIAEIRSGIRSHIPGGIAPGGDT